MHIERNHMMLRKEEYFNHMFDFQQIQEQIKDDPKNNKTKQLAY